MLFLFLMQKGGGQLDCLLFFFINAYKKKER